MGVDTVNVQATSGPTTVNTGGGSNLNVVNVGSLEPAIGGIVDHIQGSLSVIGNGADTLNIDDTGSKIAKTGALTAFTITGLNMGPSGVAFSGLANLNIDLGSGGNTFTIANTSHRDDDDAQQRRGQRHHQRSGDKRAHNCEHWWRLEPERR